MAKGKMPAFMMAKFEKSGMDKKADKAGAKKAGVSVKKYEGSAADKKADAKMMPAFLKGKGKGKG
jgi:hypothetical protein